MHQLPYTPPLEFVCLFCQLAAHISQLVLANRILGVVIIIPKSVGSSFPSNIIPFVECGHSPCQYASSGHLDTPSVDYSRPDFQKTKSHYCKADNISNTYAIPSQQPQGQSSLPHRSHLPNLSFRRHRLPKHDAGRDRRLPTQPTFHLHACHAPAPGSQPVRLPSRPCGTILARLWCLFCNHQQQTCRPRLSRHQAEPGLMRMLAMLPCPGHENCPMRHATAWTRPEAHCTSTSTFTPNVPRRFPPHRLHAEMRRSISPNT